MAKKPPPQPAAKRKSTGKRLRFSIFARDNFTCRYCGVQADNAVLVIDHLIPVAKGGSSEEENLITACESCNQGKAAKLINEAALSDNDRLKFAQERNEQMKQAEIARHALKARQAMQAAIIRYWCEARGTTQMEKSTYQIIASYVTQYGPQVVFGWIDKAVAKVWHAAPDSSIGKYISGIRRIEVQEGRLQ